MRIRCNESPAPVVVDQSSAASAALIVEPQAVEAPKPEIFWRRSERFTVTSPAIAVPPPQDGAPPPPVTPPPLPPVGDPPGPPSFPALPAAPDPADEPPAPEGSP